jgi:hypothetical protein
VYLGSGTSTVLAPWSFNVSWAYKSLTFNIYELVLW